MRDHPEAPFLRGALPSRAVLGRYRIEKVLGHGGFGIVYKARHLELGLTVAIKELYPAELAVRAGNTVQARSADSVDALNDAQERFLREGRRLVQFRNHPDVVTCTDLFRANGTAYLVMEFVDGESLAELLRRREAVGQPFNEDELLAVARPLVEGLSRVHDAGILHRDIKPSNILIRREDSMPVLIDFGAAKQAVAVHTRSVAPVTAGYAAIEQVADGKLGTWTDMYAVGAVLWRIVAGGNPPWNPPNPVKVESRLSGRLGNARDPLPMAVQLGANRFAQGVLVAIDKCLEMDSMVRVRDCRELLSLLSPDLRDIDVPVDPFWNKLLRRFRSFVPGATTRRQRRSIALMLVSVLTVAIASWVLLVPDQSGSGRSREIQPSVDLVVPTENETQTLPTDIREIPPVEKPEVPPLEVGGTVPEEDQGATPAREQKTQPGTVWENGLGMQFAWISKGTFRMGSTSREALEGESPLTEVTITQGFWMGKHEVTQGNWSALMGNNPSLLADCGADCPVESVSWDDVQEFLKVLNRRESARGHEYRLPTEAEWEYAAKAGTVKDRYAADLESIAWFHGNSGGRTHPVGRKAANPWGLHDMLGNVWEWVQGRYGAHPGGRVTDPVGVDTGAARVNRGGGWDSLPRSCRSTSRFGNPPGDQYGYLGFRVVRAE